jgi:hypothetical protein
MGLEQTAEIELMLEDLGGHIFVNTIEWVPCSLLSLAVICNAFVKVYDVPIDCFSPMLCLTPDGKEFFTSAVLAVSGEEPIGFFATNCGRIAALPLGADALEGELCITQRAPVYDGIPPMATISACPASDLFFVAAPEASLLLFRLSAAIAGQPIVPVCVDLPVERPSVFVTAVGPLHYFGQPATGVVMTLEFTNAAIEVAVPKREGWHNEVPLLDGTCATLSGSISAFSPASG